MIILLCLFYRWLTLRGDKQKTAGETPAVEFSVWEIVAIQRDLSTRKCGRP
jgi:hypothetical protein